MDTEVIFSQTHKHGSFTIKASGDLLIAFPKGTWSTSCLDDYIETITELRRKRNMTRFASIICMRHWQLAPPEVLATMRSFNQHAKNQGMVAQWLIGRPSNMVALRVAEQTLKQKVDFVKTSIEVEDCLDELQSLGLSFDPSRVISAFEKYSV